MERRLGAAVRAATRVACALLSVFALSCAHNARIDEIAFRLDYAAQQGRGLQSQADVQLVDGLPRGSEAVAMALPKARIGIRHTDRIRHVIDMPVDIITSASADALDAVSSASLWTEAATVDGRTYIDLSDDDRLEVQWGMHLEEVMKGGSGGLGYRRELANDNAILEVRGGLIIDMFDPITPQGFDYGRARRRTAHASIAASQILSPTTWIDGSYGLTYQWGVLATTWNGTATTDGGLYTEELFPGSRLRHALSGGIAQFVPATRSALRGRYRFYADDFDVQAHTITGEWLQWMGSRAYLRLGYRFHRQSAVNFFVGEPTDGLYESGARRTSDSDLAAFDAHEWSTQLVFFLDRNGPRGNESLNLSFSRYTRPYFELHRIGLGYSRTF